MELIAIMDAALEASDGFSWHDGSWHRRDS